ncbi:hypothetical protein GCM10027578_22000 [Spirosoma luteolum]
MKKIAIVDIELVDNTPKVTAVTPFQDIDADTFSADWLDGQQARAKWEQFCNAFYHLLTESGLVDANGIHVDEYTPGSVCRFILANPTMIPADFRDTGLGMIVMQAIKTGAKTIKKGKAIEINWESINAHTGPMTEAVLKRMVLDPQRADLLLPIFSKYFTMPDATAPAEIDA